ncbi:MAG: endonuclease/exonuclease/phosphatase family protein [Bacteroidota bacterium]
MTVTERFKNNMIQTSLSSILVVGTAIVLLSPQVPLIRKVSEYSVHIMLGMLLFSMLAMVFKKPKVMFTALACTAALCIFLKNASLDTLNYSKENTETKLNVAHINLGNLPFEITPIENLLKDENIEVVSFQELTPNWDRRLRMALSEAYPHSILEKRADFYGLGIFSRFPFAASDIFECEGKPNLNVIIAKDETNFQVISSHLTPALDNQSLNQAAEQLNSIADHVNNSNEPLIALGEYNMVYWANEIRNFRAKTNLQNSRRDLVDGNLRVPYDHIFFSNALECTQFKEVKDLSQNYLGIIGTYQIKGEEESLPSGKVQLSMNNQ